MVLIENIWSFTNLFLFFIFFFKKYAKAILQHQASLQPLTKVGPVYIYPTYYCSVIKGIVIKVSVFFFKCII